MIILPKILYILRTLPINIPGRIFHQFQTQMSTFIWQNKKPRLSLSLMQKKLHFGEMGLPDLKAYHIAVTLDQIRYWWHGSPEKQWVTMEAELAGIPNWRAVLLDPIGGAPCMTLNAPPIRTTLAYWRALISDSSASGVSHLPIPVDIAALHILNLVLKSWTDRGIVSLHALYDGLRPRTFLELQEKYGLPDTEYLKLSQILHLTRHLKSTQCSLPSLLLPLFQSASAYRPKGSKIFYDLTTKNDVFIKTRNIVKWENDLGKAFSPLQWQTAIRWAHTSSSCANYREQFKK